MSTKTSLSDFTKVFLKLGFTAFGGPAAHMAMMRTEVVEKRKWLSEKEFLDFIGATHLIPGPNSTELALFIGKKLFGDKGLLVAGLAFILPAFFIVLGFGYLYKAYGTLPELGSILIGMRPVIVSVIAIAMLKFGKTAIVNWSTLVVFVSAIFFSLVGQSEVSVIFGLGLLYALFHSRFSMKVSIAPELFLFFLKVGSLLFGSGYVLLAYLQKGLVDEKKLLSTTQLLDAITIGQVTPGPVFTTATFIGYIIAGYKGAVLSTVGIFLPSFFFVIVVTPYVQKLRNSPFFSHFLDGVNAASLGLMFLILIKLGQEGFFSYATILLGVSSLVILYKFAKLNSAFLIILGGLIGYAFL